MRGKKRTMRLYLQASSIIPLALALALAFCFTSVSPALAHKVYLFPWVDGDTIYLHSHFRGKKKVKGGTIKVFDPSGMQLLEKKTDEKGKCSFKIPQKTDLRIVLEASTGHRAEYTLKVEEMLDTAVIPDAVKETDRLRDSSPGAVQTDLEQIKTVMEKAVDDRLKPIVRMLARIQEEKGPGFNEIIGGIGYIFGLMGIVLYFKSRKKL
jgi:nickel transport protein